MLRSAISDITLYTYYMFTKLVVLLLFVSSVDEINKKVFDPEIKFHYLSLIFLSIVDHETTYRLKKKKHF